MTGVVVPLLPFHHRWREHIVLHGGDEIDAYALAVVAALHVHMNTDGVCSVGVRRLAQIARVSVPTVRDRLGRLERAGLLEIHRNGQSRSWYRAVLPTDGPGGPVKPDGTPDRSSDRTEVCNHSSDAVQPGDTNCATGGDTFTPLYEHLRGRARAREAPPAQQPVGRKRRRKRRVRSTPSLAAGGGGVGPTPRREPVPWQVEVRPDGTWWVRRVAS